MEDDDEERGQGDQLMARKHAKQSRPPGQPAWGAPSAVPFPPTPHHTDDPNELASAAAAQRTRHNTRFQGTDRVALYNAWPEDTVYLKQQIALLQQELQERDKQLSRAHTDIRVLTHELEQQRQQHQAELRKVQLENLSQLIHTFQTDGIHGLEGLARMQHSGQFAEEREKERQRVHELERGVMHDMEAMRREYEDKLHDMKEEYQMRLHWLARKQSRLESAHQVSEAASPASRHRPVNNRQHPPPGQRRSSSQGPPVPRPHTPTKSNLRKQPSQRSTARTGGIDHQVHTNALAHAFYTSKGY